VSASVWVWARPFGNPYTDYLRVRVSVRVHYSPPTRRGATHCISLVEPFCIRILRYIYIYIYDSHILHMYILYYIILYRHSSSKESVSSPSLPYNIYIISLSAEPTSHYVWGSDLGDFFNTRETSCGDHIIYIYICIPTLFLQYCE